MIDIANRDTYALKYLDDICHHYKHQKSDVIIKEYVRNATNAIAKIKRPKNCEIKIWTKDTWCSDNALCILDNGAPMSAETFRTDIINHSGLGRWCGLAVCDKLTFVNITNYTSNEFEYFTINGYKNIDDNNTIDSLEIKYRGAEFCPLSYEALMNYIGEFHTSKDATASIIEYLSKYNDLLKKTNTGFLVIMEGLSMPIRMDADNDAFIQNLKWQLPVDFESALYEPKYFNLIGEIIQTVVSANPEKPREALFCEISYNDIPLYRPIDKTILSQNYFCRNYFGVDPLIGNITVDLAVGLYAFNRSLSTKFKNDDYEPAVSYTDKDNAFCGIRIYVDNMLIADTDEVMSLLETCKSIYDFRKDLLRKTMNIIIYITNDIATKDIKKELVVADNEYLIKTLKAISEFLNRIYTADKTFRLYKTFKEKNDDPSATEKAKDEAMAHMKRLVDDYVLVK